MDAYEKARKVAEIGLNLVGDQSSELNALLHRRMVVLEIHYGTYDRHLNICNFPRYMRINLMASIAFYSMPEFS